MLTRNNLYGGFSFSPFDALFSLFLYRIPFQQSGYIPLEAGKYYWIEALHKEGARRDSLSVGYTLECPNAPSVLSERPILKPSLQHKIPSKCCCSTVIHCKCLLVRFLFTRIKSTSRKVEKQSGALASAICLRFCCIVIVNTLIASLTLFS